ncbi:HD domain-containing protein [Candidatus Tisiphia endosymbiont of Nemotelus uliginosus]|uniref:HD domain-containing protein n=1 Tax=Candidatus Tisiphia endosymbiont of Nemotelus uliginosus TaxID=3077926 RepID=UPI0035C936DC
MLAHSMVKVNDNKLHEALSYITYHSYDIAYALETTEILLTIYPNNDTVIAGLLSTAISTTDLSNITLHLQKITCQFGTEIANIVEGILKASTIHYLPYNTRQAQRFFDYLLSMPEEVAVGVLLVRLTHLLHNVSIFSVTPSLEKYAISALEIMEIYVPLLSRIGLEEIKIELQEICLTILQPDIREYILTHLSALCGKDIKTLINKIINSLHNNLQTEGIQAKIFGRIKTPYSIWLKMLQKNINIGQLYDILAFRIIVENVEDCYKALAVIHTRYQNVKCQFQDYIRQPKSNGYQSLHTIIIGPTKKNIEIQIRTCAMNEKAQHGAAAHWQYKKKPTIIKERVYNIYQSLYQAAYLPIINIFKTSIRERDIKQHIYKLYKFELYKELGIVRNINSRLLFNNNLANICQNNSNTILALLEPTNINLDFNHILLRANDCNVHLNTDSIPTQAIAQLMNKLTIHTDQKLLLDTLPIGLYISDDSNMIFASCHSAQLAMKIEPLKFQAQSTNSQTTQPLLMDPLTKNKQHHDITKATLVNQQARHESSDHDAISSLPLSALLTMIIRQTLGNNSQALDNHAMNPPNENVYTPLIQAVISNNKEQVVEMLQDQELNPNESSTFIPACRTSSDIWPAFLLAVYMREEVVVRAFLAHPKVDVTQQNPDFETVLIVAAQTSNIKVFRLLVNYFKANWQYIFKSDIEQFREYINWGIVMIVVLFTTQYIIILVALPIVL